MALGHEPAFARAAVDLTDLSATRQAAHDAVSEEPDEERKQQRLQDLERYESLYDGAWIEGLLRGLAEHSNNAGDADLARPYGVR